MAKDLPYFKFFTGEWMNGDITLEDYAIQGVFVNVCAYYWDRQGKVTLKNAKKRFLDAHSEIDALINTGIIKPTETHLVIEFLDEQMSDRERKAQVSRVNGCKGGRPRKDPEKPDPKNPGNPPGSPGFNPEKPNKEESRGEKKKEEKRVYGEHQNVRLTDTEYQKLSDGWMGKQGFGPTLDSYIQRLSVYKAGQGKKYKCDYAVMQGWVHERYLSERGSTGKSMPKLEGPR